jgi:predicted HTH domain antitoxin
MDSGLGQFPATAHPVAMIFGPSIGPESRQQDQHFEEPRVHMLLQLAIPYDDSVLLQAGLGRDEFEREARLLLAGKLFELRRLSSGEAAELCGMGRVEFLIALQRVDVSTSNLGPEAADDDARFATRS